MSFAKVQLYGNLGRDPEVRYTPTGTPVCDFSMATSERFNKNGEKQEKTTWWKVIIWGKQAEVASQYLTKGRPVFIEGRPSLEEWTDRDGKQRTTLAVHATDMQFISGGRDESGGQKPNSSYENRGGGQQGGGRAPGPKEQYRQQRQQSAEQSSGGGLSLDDSPEGTDDDTPF